MPNSTSAPSTGPSNVPNPPSSTMKIMYAVHWMPKMESGVTASVLIIVIAPAAPQPTPASRNTTRFARATGTPTDCAAASSSRIDCSAVPSLLRSSTKPSTTSTVMQASATQYVYACRSAGAYTLSTSSEVRCPHPATHRW